jgi:hypothetical protein
MERRSRWPSHGPEKPNLSRATRWCAGEAAQLPVPMSYCCGAGYSSARAAVNRLDSDFTSVAFASEVRVYRHPIVGPAGRRLGD